LLFFFPITPFPFKKNTRIKNGLQKLTQEHPFSRKNSKYVPPKQRCQKINGQNRKTQKKHSINTSQTFCSTTILRLQKLKLEPTKPKSKYEGTQSPSALLPRGHFVAFFRSTRQREFRPSGCSAVRVLPVNHSTGGTLSLFGLPQSNKVATQIKSMVFLDHPSSPGKRLHCLFLLLFTLFSCYLCFSLALYAFSCSLTLSLALFSFSCSFSPF
jgi:hypothetical protein